MKKLLALLVFLMFVSFVSATLDIHESSVELLSTSPVGNVVMSQTGSSIINVTFSGTTMACLSDGSETLGINIQSPMPLQANTNQSVSFNIGIPNNQFSCRYHTTLQASSSQGSDSVEVYLNVTPNPSITVNDKTDTLVRNITPSKTMNVRLDNTGNTNVFFQYNYTNFSRGGYVLAAGGSGAKLITHGASSTMPIALSIPQGIPDGVYTSTFILSGDVNKTDTLSVEVKTPSLSVSLPEFTMPETDRNATAEGTFVIKNTGDFTLSGIAISTDANSEYDVVISNVPYSLSPGDEAIITISAFTPEDEDTNVHKIGNLYFDSNVFSETVPLNLDVRTKLQINKVTVTIDGSSHTADHDGDIIDDTDTHPGSEFEAKVEICNRYDDRDFSISNIEGTATFEEVDDGDDIEGNIDSFDLDGNKCKKVSVSFDKSQISYLSDDGTYDMVIDLSGDDDEYDIEQADKWTIGVRVYREDNPALLFDEVRLAPSSVACGGSTDLSILAYNIGDRDNNAKLRIYSADLGIDITKFFKIGDTTSDDCDAIEYPDDKCIEIDHTFALSIPSNINAGNYPIEVSTYRDETRQTDKETVTLAVSCGGVAPTQPTTPTTPTIPTTPTTPTTPSTPGNVVITPSPSTSGSTAAGTPVRIKDISNGTSPLWTIGLIAGIAIAALLIVLVIVALVGRKS